MQNCLFRNEFFTSKNLLLHPAWKSRTTEGWPELPAMNTFENRGFSWQNSQQKCGNTIYQPHNIAQRLVSDRFH